jgi:hypothetical protein
VAQLGPPVQFLLVQQIPIEPQVRERPGDQACPGTAGQHVDALGVGVLGNMQNQRTETA